MTVALEISVNHYEVGYPYKVPQLSNQSKQDHGPWNFEGPYDGPLIVYIQLLIQIHM